MEPLGNSSPTPNQHPPLLYAQSSLTFSLLATSRYCFSPPITCVLQEVNTHQQPTQKLPLCGINSSLYYVRPGSVWTAKVCRLLLQSTSERWQMAVGGQCNSNTCHLWLEWRTNKPLCVQLDYILIYMMKQEIRLAGIRFQILCTNQCFQYTESLCFVN